VVREPLEVAALAFGEFHTRDCSVPAATP
jgi:hypothetical protein